MKFVNAAFLLLLVADGRNYVTPGGLFPHRATLCTSTDVNHVARPPGPPWQIGNLACTVVAGSNSHESLTCVAPPRQIDAHSMVQVTVDGQSATPVMFR